MVSIILPVYNAEQNIIQTIKSILSQSISSWELIIINDGSTDRTLNLINQFDDSRIRVINQANSGRSQARNKGIASSKGEWIFFVDADDILPSDSLEVLTQQSQNADVIIGGYSSITTTAQYNLLSSNYKTPNSYYLIEASDQPGINLTKMILNAERYSSIVNLPKYNTKSNIRSIWGKLYKTSLIKNNGHKFYENLKFGEDVIFNSLVYSDAKVIRIISYCSYFYNETQQGTTRQYKDSDSNHIIEFADVANTVISNQITENRFDKIDVNQFIFAEFMRFFFRAAHYSDNFKIAARTLNETFNYEPIKKASTTYSSSNILVNTYYHFLIVCFRCKLTYAALLIAKMIAKIVDGTG